MANIIDKVFPVTIMFMNLIASVIYLYSKDYGRFIYWFSAFLLNMSVIFLIK